MLIMLFLFFLIACMYVFIAFFLSGCILLLVYCLKAILHAVATILPKAEHRHYVRHIFALWHETYKGDG